MEAQGSCEKKDILSKEFGRGMEKVRTERRI
jgi:hypothetical protein